MQQKFGEISVTTGGKGLTECTRSVVEFVRDSGIENGLCTVFIRHTSASLLIQENADPTVLVDLQSFFARVVPEGDYYAHDDEGPDDMPAHIRAALTQTSLSIPVMDGGLALGTWQGIYVFEHRRARHLRQIALHVIGI